VTALRHRTRRDLLRASGSGTATALFASDAAAQQPTWPARAVTVVVPFPPGGATDLVARVLAQGLGPRLGQQVVVENRPGANGAVGSAHVARAQPDGHTLVMGGVNAHAMNEAVHRGIAYATLRDFAPVALCAYIPVAMVAHPSVPAAALVDLAALARARPGTLPYGSAGAGGQQHLAMELLKQAAGIDLVHVPYPGGAPQLTDLLAGRVQVGAIGASTVLPHLEPAGRLRALAVVGGRRAAALPGVPTVAEAAGLPGFAVEYWLGLFAPAGTPGPVVRRLNAEANAVLGAPEVRDGLLRQGAEPATATLEECARLVGDDVARWAGVVRRGRLALEQRRVGPGAPAECDLPGRWRRVDFSSKKPSTTARERRHLDSLIPRLGAPSALLGFAMPTRPNADWPAAFPPLSIAAESARDRRWLSSPPPRHRTVAP
jgi:tripartite-type tricarboxylate transporter receptor subunit TctC